MQLFFEGQSHIERKFWHACFSFPTVPVNGLLCLNNSLQVVIMVPIMFCYAWDRFYRNKSSLPGIFLTKTLVSTLTSFLGFRPFGMLLLSHNSEFWHMLSKKWEFWYIHDVYWHTNVQYGKKSCVFVLGRSSVICVYTDNYLYMYWTHFLRYSVL